MIKNLIFDFGGVIINIDHLKVENAFKDLGMDNFEKMFNRAIQSKLFQNLETGKISPAEFRDSIRNITGLNVSDPELDRTWNQIIVDYPSHRIDLLKSIRKNYRMFILSNTNQIHYEHYMPKFKSEFGFDFLSLFEETFWSFKIGVRKPDPDPFLLIVNQLELIPSETLFIDDSIQNIQTAEKLNFKVFYLKPPTEVNDLFEDGWLKQDLDIQ